MTENPEQQLLKIRQKAEKGDHYFQFHLAQKLINSDMEEAVYWMERAALSGRPEILFVLAVWHTDGLMMKREMEKGLHYLNEAIEKGFNPALNYRAVLKSRGIGGIRDWLGAVSDILDLAKRKDAGALNQLVLLLDLAGNPETLAIKNTLANFVASIPKVPSQKKPNHPADQERYLPQNLFAQILKALKNPPCLGCSQIKKLASNPKIMEVKSAITPAVADYLISRAIPFLIPSKTIDRKTQAAIQEGIRTSTEMRFWPAGSDLVVEAVCYRIAAFTNLSIDHQETLGVLRYRPGQEYRPHHDFLYPDSEGRNPEVERAGQRVMTFLIYLNEDFEGGETEFERIGLRFKGNKGDGIMFNNVTDKGEADILAQHAGLPVKSGEKFITTLWIRDKTYSYPPPRKNQPGQGRYPSQKSGQGSP